MIAGKAADGVLFLSTPSARRATEGSTSPVTHLRFLSTPSARRATSAAAGHPPGIVISIHALREEGDRLKRDRCETSPISIHALREEGDRRRESSRATKGDFYPRPPRGGRRRAAGVVPPVGLISIHALREEGDKQRQSVD